MDSKSLHTFYLALQKNFTKAEVEFHPKSEKSWTRWLLQVKKTLT